MKRGPWLYVVATAYALGLGALVLTPIAGLLNRLTVKLYVIWKYDLHLPGNVLPEHFGFALNVLLFIPLGLLLVLFTRRPWWVATLACVLTSACIEGIQTLPFLHRFPSIADVISNGLGGLVGALVATWWIRRTTRRPLSPLATRRD